MHAIDQRPTDSHLTEQTREVVLRYHQCWKHRDLEAVLALYHPQVQYNDFFQNRTLGYADLRDYVQSTMPSRPEEFLDHIDRIRVDGDTAFIQYRIAVTLSGRLATFHSSEAITVRDKGGAIALSRGDALFFSAGDSPVLPDADFYQIAIFRPEKPG